MTVNENMIDELRARVKERLSERRYEHTLGVERAALKIASYCFSGDMNELRAAALLHDISKEYPIDEQLRLIREFDIPISDSDLVGESVLHSITAGAVIKRDFPQFATENILSAVKNHTVGSPDMSIFDEIIFISDFIEDGRKYSSCIKVRESLLSSLEASRDREECIARLHDATIESLDLTIMSIIKDGRYLNERAVTTRNAFIGRKPTALN